MMLWITFSVCGLLLLQICSIDKDPVGFGNFLVNLQRTLGQFLGFGFLIIGVAFCAAGANWNITIIAALYTALGCLMLFLEKSPKGKFD